MATASEVTDALDSIAAVISDSKKRRATCKANLEVARNQLHNLPTTYSAEIATINAYTPSGDFEPWAQAVLAAYTSDFQSEKAGEEAELVAVGAVAASEYTSLNSTQKANLVTALQAIASTVSAAITTLGG